MLLHAGPLQPLPVRHDSVHSSPIPSRYAHHETASFNRDLPEPLRPSIYTDRERRGVEPR